MLAAAIGAALAIAATVTPAAEGVTCERGVIGGGPSTWGIDEAHGELDRARLRDLSSTTADGWRPNSLAGYGVVEINGEDYDNNPAPGGCRLEGAGQEIAFPADVLTLPGLEIRPKLYVHPRKSFARQYVVLRNESAGPLTFDFGWDGLIALSPGVHELHTTSSGNAIIDAADRWAVSCIDPDGDGCANVVGEGDRAAELTHSFEGPAAEESPAVTLADNSNDFQVAISDVTLPAGKAKAYMEVVSLSRDVIQAQTAAAAIDADPAGYGVFAGLSKREQKRLRNW